MDNPDLKQLTGLAIRAAEAASAVILDVYQSGDFQAEYKDDFSPLTLADKRSHEAIEAILKESSLPILSEEGKDIPYAERRNWKNFWLIDPLDGTREFIKRNGEFTVNIALIENQTAVLGVVAVPVTGEIYSAFRNAGASRKHHHIVTELPKRSKVDLTQPGVRVVASRAHMDEATKTFIGNLVWPELTSAGSSLKFLLLASGKADVYPRFAPTMEWDTAAPHAILNEVGMKVCRQGSEQELVYNKPDLLNPHFICY